MMRDDGLMRADIDVGLLVDPKMLKLRRLVPDEGELAILHVVYMQTLLGSWREGRRLSASEAESVWEATTDRVSALQEVGLLDDEARIPEAAWDRHHGPAEARIQKRREDGRKGGLKSAAARKHRSSSATAHSSGAEPKSSTTQAPLKHHSSGAEPSQPASQPAPPPPTGGGGGLDAGERDDAPASPARTGGFVSLAELLPSAEASTGWLAEHLNGRQRREH